MNRNLDIEISQKMHSGLSPPMIFEFSLNVSLNSVTIIIVKGLEPAICCVRDQDAATAPARHMRETWSLLFTARNEVGARLCFYTCLWFCSQGGLPHCMLGYTPRDQRRAHPPGADTPHPSGTRGTTPGPGTPPVQCMPGDTGNKRAVRILLECNLFLKENSFTSRFTVVKRSNENRAYFWLLIDEDRYTYNYQNTSGTGNPTGITTINIELTAGQIVRVENDHSSVIYGTDSNGIIQSWFTGFLLYALWIQIVPLLFS